jgi:hypothetical protein
MQYDRLSPPAAGRRDSADGDFNVVQHRGGGVLDPSHSPPHHDLVGELDTQSLLGGRKKATWGAFVTVTPPPLSSAVKGGTVALRHEDGV